jgi:adenosylcobinamide kinase/adenosylcobinamide-phosphate guanylyltransferase
MPHSEEKSNEMPVAPVDSAYIAPLLIAIQQFQGAIVLVGNEIGLGVIPLGREVRKYVDALGLLNQQVAASCERVTLMAAGLPLILK